MPAKIPTEDLIAELQRLADELGHTPSKNEMAAHGAHTHGIYQHRFGSWNEAINAAGLEPNNRGGRIAADALLDELRRLADELGKTPSHYDMAVHGAYAKGTYQDHFGSWNEAIKAAGLEPNKGGSRIPTADLLDELRRLADELNTAPTCSDMKQHGRYDPATYSKRFGSWDAAIEEIGLEPNPQGGEGRPSNADLLEALQALAIELERTPEYEDVDTYTDINPEWYLTRWDSWWVACSMAGVTQTDLAGVFDAHDEADMEGSA